MRVLPAQDRLVLQQVTELCACRDSRVILTNKTQYSRSLQ